ncbi:amidohydrolase [Aliamphritea hakodatensis]|uniref:amidohydrolase n=1 Tax=Aliamphritea hakodatensis TaxID=2895352 RepID=UPI0022FD8565|nr:amidohydrolase [Aliamphritea hakodatensis]
MLDRFRPKTVLKHIAVSCLFSSGLGASPVQAADADYLFVNGKVYTQNDEQPWTEAVAVQGNKIVYVGDNEGAKASTGQNTEIIDLEGRMVLPGLIDAHSHPIVAAGMSHMGFLDRSGTIEEWLKDIKAYADSNPDMKSILLSGFSVSAFGPEGPTKELLDAIIPDRPVVVIDDGFHAAWVNSKALELANIDKNTPDPLPGSHFYQRDKDGNPTGWCREQMTFFPMMEQLGAVSQETIISGAENVFPLYMSNGYTSVYDAGFSYFEGFAYPALNILAENERLPFRIVTSHMVQGPHQLTKAVNTLQGYAEKYSSELVTPRVMKIVNDGTSEAYTAAQYEPYEDQHGHKGETNFNAELLKSFVIDVEKAGFDTHIHTIGDRAVAEALDAYEAADKAVSNKQSRRALAHVELVRDEDLERFGQLNVISQTTPFWFANDGVLVQGVLGEERAAKLYRFREVLNSGGKVTFGSDFPSTGDIAGMGPLINIEMGMTRKFAGVEDMPATPPLNETLTLEQMIRGFTLDAAYQLGLSDKIGSLEVGKLADITILDKNLFEIAPNQIHKVNVVMTMSNGRIVFQQ